jgi:hypothetical protein
LGRTNRKTGGRRDRHLASESAASFRRTRVERYSAETKGRTLEAIETDRRENASLAD